MGTVKLRRKLKYQARRALRGRLWQAQTVFLLWGLTWGAVSLGDRAAFLLAGERLGWSPGAVPAGGWLSAATGTLWVTLAAAVVRTILLTPLWAGAAAWFAALVEGRSRPLGTVFWPYGNRVWLRSLGVRLYTGLLTGVVTFLPLLGMAASLWLLRGRLARLSTRELALAIGGVGTAVVIWLLIAWTYRQRFAMAVYLLGPDHGLTAREAIRRSVRDTRGHRWRLARMDLSFLPWLAACLLVLPILYVLPYYTASRVRYFAYLARRGAEKRVRIYQTDSKKERVTAYGKEHRV